MYQDTFTVPTTQGFCACEVFRQGGWLLAVPIDSLSQVGVHCLPSGEQKAIIKTAAEGNGYGMCMGVKYVEDDATSLLLAGYEDGSIVVFDARMWKELSRCNFHPECVIAFDYCKETNKGVSVSTNENIVLWTISAGMKLQKLTEVAVRNPGFGCVQYRSDGKLFITGGWDSKARIFSGKKNKPLAILDYHKDTIQCVSFANDNRIAVGSKDANISVWSVYT